MRSSNAVYQDKRTARFSYLAIALVFFVVWAAICPAVAQASFYSVKDEIEIGKRVGKAIEKEYKLSPDQAAQERVERLGRALATASDRPDLPYTFKVLAVDEVNALALPGGPVYVFKGLADYMSDDELAGVIGHEIGHIVKRHSIKQMEKSMGMGLVMLLLLGGKALPLQSLVQQAVMAGYSRDDEREADYQGFLLTTKAGFNPYSMQLGLEKLAKLHDAPDFGLFSSHPEPQARVARLKGYLQKSGIKPQVVANSKLFQVVDGTWTFETDEATAYAVAGALYRVSRKGQIMPDWFILDSDGSTVYVYYDDVLVWTVTEQQAAIAHTTAEEMASQYAGVFRGWAESTQAARTADLIKASLL